MGGSICIIVMVYMNKDDKIAKDAIDDHKRIYVVTPETFQIMALWLSYFGIFTYSFDLLAKPLPQSRILFRQLLELLMKMTWK